MVSLFHKFLRARKSDKSILFVKNDYFIQKIQYSAQKLKKLNVSAFNKIKIFWKTISLKWKINKIKFHLFEKTYKKEFSKFIFTIEFRVKIWELLAKNAPEKIPDKPTVQIENRLLQVIQILFSLLFIHSFP